MPWSNVTSDPRWAPLDEPDKRIVADRFFKDTVVSDPRYGKLNAIDRNTVYSRFLSEAFPPPPKKPTIGERLTLTGEEDNLGGVLGPPLRGLLQTPLQFGTGIARALATIAPSEDAVRKYGGDFAADWLPTKDSLLIGADMVDKAVQYMLPQVQGKYAQPLQGEWYNKLYGLANPWRVFNVLAEQGPTILALGLKGLAYKKALTLFYSAIGTGQATQAINDYEMKTGESVPAAYKVLMPVLVGGFSGILDVIGINEVFGKGATASIKSKFIRTLVQAVVEGGTEFMQEGLQILGEMGYTKHDAGQTFDRLALNMYGGLLLGGVAAGGINYLGEGSIKNANRTKLDKSIEITSEAVGKQIDAEAELPLKPFDVVNKAILNADEQSKIALNNEFVNTKIVNVLEFNKGVYSETGINGIMSTPISEVDFNIQQEKTGEGAGFLVTGKMGDKVGTLRFDNYEGVASYFGELNSNYEKQIYKQHQSNMRAPDLITPETKLRQVETTLKFYDNLDAIKGNVNLEQLPLKNLTKEEQAFIRSVAQDLKDAGEKVVTPDRLKQAVEASKIPIDVVVETPTTQSIAELKAAFQQAEQTPEVVKRLASLEDRAKTPILLSSRYTVPGYNPPTHNRWLFTTPVDFGEEAHGGISATNAIGWAEVAESAKDSKTLMVFEVQASDSIREAMSPTSPTLSRRVALYTFEPEWSKLQEEFPTLKSLPAPVDSGMDLDDWASLFERKYLPELQRAKFIKRHTALTSKEYTKWGPLPLPQNIIQLAPHVNSLMYRSIIQEAASRGYERVLIPTGETVAQIEGNRSTVELYDKNATRIEKEYKGKTERVMMRPSGTIETATKKNEGNYLSSNWLQVNLTPELAQKAVPLFRRTEGQEPSTQTKEFKTWFGESKVVDKEGQPLVMYHGTMKDFNTFDKSKIGTENDPGWYASGFHFTPSAKSAAGYVGSVDNVDVSGSKGQNIMPVYLKLENPYIINSIEKLKELTTKYGFSFERLSTSKNVTALLKADGYDGVIVFDYGKGKSNELEEVIAFEPTQIKSATGNIGTFDPNNPNIRLRKVTGQESQVVDPANDPNFQRVLEHARKTGIAVDIEVVDHLLSSEETGLPEGKTAEGAYWERSTNTPNAGKIKVSTPNGLYTIFHELTHAWIDALGRNDPLVKQAANEFYREAVIEAKNTGKKKPVNSEEVFAGILGEYATGRLLNPDIEARLTDLISKVRVAVSNNVSKEDIARTVVNRMLERDPLQLTRAKIDPQFETPASKLVEQNIGFAREEADIRKRRMKEPILDAINSKWFDRTPNFVAALRRIGGPLAKQLEMKFRLSASAENNGLIFAKSSMSSIRGGLTSNELDYVNELIDMQAELSKAELDKRYVLESGNTIKGLKEALIAREKSDPEKFAFLNARAALYFDTTNGLLDIIDMIGYFSKKKMEKLRKNKKYATSDHLSKDNPVDPLMESKFGGPAHRSLDYMGLLEEYIARVFRLKARNEVNLELHDLVKANPDAGLGSLTEPKTGNPVKVVGRFNGEDRVTWMSERLGNELRGGGDMVLDKAVLRWARMIALTKLVKFIAVGAHPFWQLFFNLPMDLGMAQMFTNTWSPHLPKGLYNMAQDLAATFKETLHKEGPNYNPYRDLGGLQEMLTNMAQYKTTRSAKFARFQELAGFIGTLTENWSRVAQVRRGKINGLSDLEAVFQSRERLDYYQGGSVAKALDAVIPFLNPGLQGARVTTRYMWNNPGTFAIKFGYLAGSAMALTAANMMFDEYEEVSEHDKLNNFIVMTPFTYKEKDGSTGRFYFKIRKEQALRPMLYVTEQLLRWSMGKSVHADAASRTASSILTSFSIDAGNMPATLRSMVALMNNYDFWKGEKIWQGAKGKMRDEWDENTPHIWRMLGAFTGMSPERLRVASGALVSPTNPFIGLTGFGLEQMLRALSPEERERSMTELLRDTTLTKGLVGTTSRRNRVLNNVMELREQEASKNINQNREVDRLAGVYWQEPTQERRKEINEYIRSQPLMDRSRLVDRYKWQGIIKDIPDRDWWLSARSDSPEIRAIRFYDRYEKANAENRRELYMVSRRLPGFSTTRFLVALRKLRLGQSATE